MTTRKKTIVRKSKIKKSKKLIIADKPVGPPLRYDYYEEPPVETVKSWWKGIWKNFWLR